MCSDSINLVLLRDVMHQTLHCALGLPQVHWVVDRVWETFKHVLGIQQSHVIFLPPPRRTRLDLIKILPTLVSARLSDGAAFEDKPTAPWERNWLLAAVASAPLGWRGWQRRAPGRLRRSVAAAQCRGFPGAIAAVTTTPTASTCPLRVHVPPSGLAAHAHPRRCDLNNSKMV